MFTERLNRIAAAGTADGYVRILLADARMLNIKAKPHTAELEEVCLSPGITVPDTEAWENEDSIELWLAGQSGGGSVYLDVPVEAVRDLIQEHGGEHADQDDVDFPPVDYQIHPLHRDGNYPVHRGTQRIGRIVRRGNRWQVLARGENQWTGNFPGPEEAADHLLELADIAAGRVTTAEEDLRAALAVHGLTPSRDQDPAMYREPQTWLNIGPGEGGAFPEEGAEPYVSVYLRDPDYTCEIAINRPVRDSDEWVIVFGFGEPDEDGPVEVDGRRFTGRDTRALAAYIADWHRNPLAVRAKALAEHRARRMAALIAIGHLPA
ncbi:hypothetical protein ACFWBC_10155 [Streptomyces sp. NPDC059985]|uniref:hypothetical protein n=1 Tax=Streptomyces sp. NPDC059985 TaxID=3347025 RepID=UPI0036A09E90